MGTDSWSESLPLKTIRLGLQQNQQEQVAAGEAGNQKNTRITTTTMTTTIDQLADGVIGISLALLGGNGHF